MPFQKHFRKTMHCLPQQYQFLPLWLLNVVSLAKRALFIPEMLPTLLPRTTITVLPQPIIEVENVWSAESILFFSSSIDNQKWVFLSFVFTHLLIIPVPPFPCCAILCLLDWLRRFTSRLLTTQHPLGKLLPGKHKDCWWRHGETRIFLHW